MEGKESKIVESIFLLYNDFYRKTCRKPTRLYLGVISHRQLLDQVKAIYMSAIVMTEGNIKRFNDMDLYVVENDPDHLFVA